MSNRNIILNSILSVFGGLILTFGALMVEPASAATCTTTNGITTCTASANAAVTVSSACSMSGGGNNTYTDTIPNGTSKDLGTTTIKTICNDPGGYAIYTIGYSDDTYGNNKLLASTVGSTYDIDTGTTASSGSWWGMKIGAVSGPYAPTIQNNFNANTFHVVPTAYTMVASYASATDGGPSATGSSITADYRVAISGTQPADTYTGKVKYALVYPASAPKPPEPLADSDCRYNSVCYAPNAWDIEGTMDSSDLNYELDTIAVSPIAGRQPWGLNASGTMQHVTSNSTVQLIAPNYSRPGYGFAGWSPDFDAMATHEAAVAANDPTMEPIVYGPNETITTGDLSTHGLILYPVWVASTGNLQDSSKVSTLCGVGSGSLTQATYNSTTGKTEATLSSMSALTDQRDGNVYTIAKLADGKCWMTENLRLDSESSSNASLAQGYGTSSTYGNFIGLAKSENANFDGTNPPIANSLYSTDNSTAGYIHGGDSNAYFERMPRYNNANTNRSLTPAYSIYTDSTSYYQWYSYGNYYNWPAVIADVSEIYNVHEQSFALTSICPKGWRLPKGGGKTKIEEHTNDFYDLGVAVVGIAPSNYTSTDRPYWFNSNNTEGSDASMAMRRFPNNYVLSGRIHDSSLGDRGTHGYYWSSTSYSYYGTFGLGFYNSDEVWPGTHDYTRYYGRPVRCLVAS